MQSAPHLFFLVNLDSIEANFTDHAHFQMNQANASDIDLKLASSSYVSHPAIFKIQCVVLKILLLFHVQVNSSFSWGYQFTHLSTRSSRGLPFLKRFESFTLDALAEFSTHLNQCLYGDSNRRGKRFQENEKKCGILYPSMEANNRDENISSERLLAKSITFVEWLHSIMTIQGNLTLNTMTSPTKRPASKTGQTPQKSIKTYLFVLSELYTNMPQMEHFFGFSLGLSQNSQNDEIPDLETLSLNPVFQEIDDQFNRHAKLMNTFRKMRMSVHGIDLCTGSKMAYANVFFSKAYLSKTMLLLNGALLNWRLFSFNHFSLASINQNIISPTSLKQFRESNTARKLAWTVNQANEKSRTITVNQEQRILTGVFSNEVMDETLDFEIVGTSRERIEFASGQGEIIFTGSLHKENVRLLTKTLENDHILLVKCRQKYCILSMMNYSIFVLREHDFSAEQEILAVDSFYDIVAQWFSRMIPKKIELEILHTNESCEISPEALVYLLGVEATGRSLDPHSLLSSAASHGACSETIRHSELNSNTDIPVSAIDAMMTSSLQNEDTTEMNRIGQMIARGEAEIPSFELCDVWREFLETYYSHVYSPCVHPEVFVEEILPMYYSLLNHVQVQDQSQDVTKKFMDFLGQSVLLSVSELEQKYRKLPSYIDQIAQVNPDAHTILSSISSSDPHSTIEHHPQKWIPILIRAIHELPSSENNATSYSTRDIPASHTTASANPTSNTRSRLDFAQFMTMQKSSAKIRECQLQILFIFEALRVHKDTGTPLFSKNLIHSQNHKNEIQSKNDVAKKQAKRKHIASVEQHFDTVQHYQEAIEEFVDMLVLWQSLETPSQKNGSKSVFFDLVVFPFYSSLFPDLTKRLCMKLGVGNALPTPQKKGSGCKEVLSPFSRQFKRMRRKAEKEYRRGDSQPSLSTALSTVISGIGGSASSRVGSRVSNSLSSSLSNIVSHNTGSNSVSHVTGSNSVGNITGSTLVSSGTSMGNTTTTGAAVRNPGRALANSTEKKIEQLGNKNRSGLCRVLSLQNKEFLVRSKEFGLQSTDAKTSKRMTKTTKEIRLASKMGGRSGQLVQETADSEHKSHRNEDENPFLAGHSDIKKDQIFQKLAPEKLRKLERRMTVPSFSSADSFLVRPKPLLFSAFASEERKEENSKDRPVSAKENVSHVSKTWESEKEYKSVYSNKEPLPILTSPKRIPSLSFTSPQRILSFTSPKRILSFTSPKRTPRSKSSSHFISINNESWINNMELNPFQKGQVIVAATPITKKALEVDRIAESPM